VIDKIIKLRKVDSTHKFALHMIESHTPFECAIIAESQTSGMGRCGRQWVSVSGNLYSSIIRKMTLSDNVSRISLATACAVHSSISKYTQDLKLHWPNDIYYKNHKISGILLTVVENWVVISVGVNIYPVEVPIAISLKDIDAEIEVSPLSLLQNILVELDRWLSLPYVNDFADIRKYWFEYMWGHDSVVTIHNGNDSEMGTIKGIDWSGRLILEKDGRNLYISSGDMFVNENNIVVNYE